MINYSLCSFQKYQRWFKLEMLQTYWRKRSSCYMALLMCGTSPPPHSSYDHEYQNIYSSFDAPEWKKPCFVLFTDAFLGILQYKNPLICRYNRWTSLQNIVTYGWGDFCPFMWSKWPSAKIFNFILRYKNYWGRKMLVSAVFSVGKSVDIIFVPQSESSHFRFREALVYP